jgi:hypothetical protein
MKALDGDTMTVYGCEFCDKSFVNVAALTTHGYVSPFSSMYVTP